MPPNDPRRLLLVVPATSYRTEAFVAAAASLGVQLTLAGDVPRLLERHGCPVLAADLADPEASAERILAAAPRGFHGVLGSDESTALLAAVVGRRLGLDTNDPEGTRAAHDKWQMRKRLAAAGVPQPAFRALSEPGEFPCVVKPPMLSGSQGVIRADDPAALERAAARIHAILANSPSGWRDDPRFARLLVESYVDGPEVAVEALVSRGTLETLAIFDKPDDLSGPFFEETLYVTPSRLPEAVQRQIVEVTAQAARALGVRHGPVHAELRVGPNGPMLIELAARSIGGLCSRTLQLSAGNLEALLVAHAVGIDYPAGRRSGAAGVMMLPIPQSGVLRAVHGIERARGVPGVSDVTISARPGDALRALPEGSSYLGFAFAEADTAGEVEAALRQAHRCLEVELAPLLNLLDQPTRVS